MPDLELLPPNSTALERALAQACRPATELPVPLRTLHDPKACPPALLPWLAWASGVEFWDSTWPEQQKRAAIASALASRRKKGTLAAVRAAVAGIGVDVRIREWFNQPQPAQPFTYKLEIEVEKTGCTLEQLTSVNTAVGGAKNVRSHQTAVEINVKSPAPQFIAVTSMVGHEVQVNFAAPQYSDGTPALDLLRDAAVNGSESTVSAIERLRDLLQAEPVF